MQYVTLVSCTMAHYSLCSPMLVTPWCLLILWLSSSVRAELGMMYMYHSIVESAMCLEQLNCRLYIIMFWA